MVLAQPRQFACECKVSQKREGPTPDPPRPINPPRSTLLNQSTLLDQSTLLNQPSLTNQPSSTNQHTPALSIVSVRAHARSPMTSCGSRNRVQSPLYFTQNVKISRLSLRRWSRVVQNYAEKQCRQDELKFLMRRPKGLKPTNNKSSC